MSNSVHDFSVFPSNSAKKYFYCHKELKILKKMRKKNSRNSFGIYNRATNHGSLFG